MSNIFTPELGNNRKEPRQKRAKETIRRIKEAMISIIETQGYSEASTNQIARLAGVNISSIYQYFPNKQAIALAIYQDTAAELGEAAHRYLSINTDFTSHHTEIYTVVSEVFAVVSQRKVVLMNMIDQIPELKNSVDNMSLQNLAYSSSNFYLKRLLPGATPEEIERKLFFIQNACMSLIYRYVAGPPDNIDQEEFCRELTELVEFFLFKASPKQTPS